MKTTKPQYSEIVNMYNSITGSHHLWEVWQDTMTMFSCTISNAVDYRFRAEREETYMKLISQRKEFVKWKL